MVIYYRFAGLVAVIGLGSCLAIIFGTMALFQFTLTLPGIAGIILTIGMAVDANVLIYERLREEMAAANPSGTRSRPLTSAPSPPSSIRTSPRSSPPSSSTTSPTAP